jgi:L-fuconolactonase
MTIDAHQHFWVYKPEDLPWIPPELPLLRRDYLPEQLAPLLRAGGVDGTVVVQAQHSQRETEWLLQLAERNPFIRGIVGWLDLRSPRLRGELERLAGKRRLKGLRHILQDEKEVDFMLGREFTAGIGLLREFGLSYDLVIAPRHLPAAVQLASRFPQQTFILDHIAKPLIKDGVRSPWDADLRRLAALPNVFCKVSGLVTEADWGKWRAADFAPYLDIVWEAFGPERLMYGSDWPVCLLAGDYPRVQGLAAGYVGALSRDEQQAFWGGVAARVYRLEDR